MTGKKTNDKASGKAPLTQTSTALYGAYTYTNALISAPKLFPHICLLKKYIPIEESTSELINKAFVESITEKPISLNASPKT